MDDIKSYQMRAEVQENGIIRNREGRLIGRLKEDVDFEGKHVRGASFGVASAEMREFFGFSLLAIVGIPIACVLALTVAWSFGASIRMFLGETAIVLPEIVCGVGTPNA